MTAAAPRRPRALESDPALFVDAGFVLALAAVAVYAAWPIYQTPYLFVTAGGAVLVGGGIALLGRLRHWSWLLTAGAVLGAYLVLGVPLAVPSAFVSRADFLAAYRQLLAATVGSWRQLVTVEAPVGHFQALLVPVLITLLVCAAAAFALVFHRARGYGALVPIMLLPVAFALAFGKRPDLLLLDEPMADLDPLARHDLSALLMSEAVERGITVVMSSHLLSELEDMCDYLLVLAGGRIRLAGDADALVPAHALVTGLVDGGDPVAALAPHTVIEFRVQGRQFQALVRPNGPLRAEWVVSEPSLEEVLLAHLRSPDAPPLYTPGARHEAEGIHSS